MQTLVRENITTYSFKANKINFLPFFGCLIYALFSNYFFLCLIAGVSLTIIVKELWKPYLPLALLYFFIYQWAQVFTVIPYLDFLNGSFDHDGQYVDINLGLFRNQLIEAISLLQLALMAMIVGYFLKKVKGLNGFSILRQISYLNTKKIIIGFFICTLIFPFLISYTRGNPSLNQMVQSFSVIRKVFLILLIFILFTKKQKLNSLIILILIAEFLLGFTSFFSDFKEVLIYIIIVYLTINTRIKFGTVLKVVPFLLFFVFVLVFWSYVKPGYRAFGSGGSRQQVIVVSKTDLLNYLWGEVKTFDRKKLSDGTEILLERIETMTLYFKVAERVPSFIPYQKGQNTMESVTFLTLPRSLNPNKGILDPSSKATYYTGIKFATAEEGTSIAMGYFPDFYIDFGMYGMTIPLILIALFIGWSSKNILQRDRYNMLFNYALLTAAVFTSGSLDSDLTFFLGVFRNFIVLFIIGNWIIFPWINGFIEKDEYVYD